MTTEDTRSVILVINIVTGFPRVDRPNFWLTANIDPTELTARLVLRESPSGPFIATYATADDPSADGTITITQIGATDDRWLYEAECLLPASFTAGLAPVDGQAGWGDLRVSHADIIGGSAEAGFFEVRIEGGITS